MCKFCFFKKFSKYLLLNRVFYEFIRRMAICLFCKMSATQIVNSLQKSYLFNWTVALTGIFFGAKTVDFACRKELVKYANVSNLNEVNVLLNAMHSRAFWTYRN